MHHQSLIVNGKVTRLLSYKAKAELRIFGIWAWDPALWADVVPTAFTHG